MEPEIRLIDPADSIADLTLLIRRAYEILDKMGFNYTGANQDEATTRERIEGYEWYVMTDGGILIGTITLQRHSRYYAGKDAWFSRQDVALCGQFGIEPGLQRRGLGARMMDFVERRAAELGAAELGLDTAEGAEHLVRFYRHRGYRFIGFIQHSGKTYRSVILSKSLSATAPGRSNLEKR
jgi:GNAT superfamily N-acetyltransferase